MQAEKKKNEEKKKKEEKKKQEEKERYVNPTERSIGKSWPKNEPL